MATNYLLKKTHLDCFFFQKGMDEMANIAACDLPTVCYLKQTVPLNISEIFSTHLGRIHYFHAGRICKNFFVSWTKFICVCVGVCECESSISLRQFIKYWQRSSCLISLLKAFYFKFFSFILACSNRTVCSVRKPSHWQTPQAAGAGLCPVPTSAAPCSVTSTSVGYNTES